MKQQENQKRPKENRTSDRKKRSKIKRNADYYEYTNKQIQIECVL